MGDKSFKPSGGDDNCAQMLDNWLKWCFIFGGGGSGGGIINRILSYLILIKFYGNFFLQSRSSHNA